MQTLAQSRNFLSPKEVARTLGVDVSAVYRAVRLGELPAVRLTNRGAIRIPTSAIDPESQERRS